MSEIQNIIAKIAKDNDIPRRVVHDVLHAQGLAVAKEAAEETFRPVRYERLCTIYTSTRKKKRYEESGK